MSKWLGVLVGLTILIALTATGASADDPPGAKLFSTYCAACHGAGGKGGLAPAIGSDAYLSQNKDATIIQITGDGVTAKGMPAWSKAKGGTLTDEQIQDIVAYLRAPNGGATVSTAPNPNASAGMQVMMQTKMTVAQSTTSQGQYAISATLKEYNGFPVIGETVTFARQTILGPLTLGTAKTDNAGTAMLVLGDVAESSQIVTSFKADKNWEAAQAQLQLDPSLLVASAGGISTRNVNLDIDEPLLAPEGSLVTPNPPLIPATLFLLVVAGIWSIYVYVMSQIVGIWRDRPNTVRDNQLRMRTR